LALKTNRLMAKLLYFGSLPDSLGTAAEDTPLPGSVSDMQSLLAWLRTRGPRWERALADGTVQVTVNKQFADPDSAFSNNDEIAIISIGLRR
jgi:molybdopterin synthase sulfur carrier subunit